MHSKIYVKDIECDNCSKEIIARLEQVTHVKNYEISKDYIDIEHSNKISSKDLVLIIEDLGFSASLKDNNNRLTFSERFNDFISNKAKYDLEYRMIKYMLITLISLLFFHIIMYLIFSWNIIFLKWIIYTDFAVVSVCGAFWHFRSYRAKVSSMTGMMIGMIFGMQTGMMFGIILGATNGLFIGSLTAMILALIFGIYSGKCCGVVGILQGSMAGVMGSIMGAMTGVMFLADNINYFMPLFMLVNIAIMQGLSYFLFEEVVENNKIVSKVHIEFSKLLFYAFTISFIIILIVIYGYRSGLSLLLFG